MESKSIINHEIGTFIKISPMHGLFSPHSALESELYINLSLVKQITFNHFEVMRNFKTNTISKIDVLQTITVDIDRVWVNQIKLDDLVLTFGHDIKSQYDDFIHILEKLVSISIN